MKLAIFLSLKGSQFLCHCLTAFLLVTKFACQLRHVRLSVKFDIGYVYENLLRNFIFG